MMIKDPIDKSKYIENIYFTSNARVGFKYLLEQMSFNNEDEILLPAYIGITDREGSGVYDPISELGINYDFYSIEQNFSINIDDFQYKITSGKFKAALLIHYFGFLHCDIELIRSMCRKNNVLLIEDCAHSLFSTYQDIRFGDFGDMSFYSLHKFLPIENGGFFKINNDNFKNLINEEFSENIDLFTLMQYCKSKQFHIAEIRTLNYQYLLNKLKDLDGLTILFPELPQGVVPMNFPVIIKNDNREQLYFFLKDKNIHTTALYYRIIDEIDRKKYPISYYLSDNILNFPIHQDITTADLDFLVECLIEYRIETG
jgi:dTDP-4-amino-4,6-dideoxygalactose transaminase